MSDFKFLQFLVPGSPSTRPLAVTKKCEFITVGSPLPRTLKKAPRGGAALRHFYLSLSPE